MIADAEINEFLEHHGVKGQKWGVRNIRKRHRAKVLKRQQGNVDILRRVASGKGSKLDKLAVDLSTPTYRLALNGGSVGAAKITLDKLEMNQKRIKAGEAKTLAFMAKLGGVRVRELDYSH